MKLTLINALKLCKINLLKTKTHLLNERFKLKTNLKFNSSLLMKIDLFLYYIQAPLEQFKVAPLNLINTLFVNFSATNFFYT